MDIIFYEFYLVILTILTSVKNPCTATTSYIKLTEELS